MAEAEKLHLVKVTSLDGVHVYRVDTTGKHRLVDLTIEELDNRPWVTKNLFEEEMAKDD